MAFLQPQLQTLFGDTYRPDVSLYRQVLEKRQRLYNAALSTNTYTPFLVPWDLLPVLFLTIGVTLSPRLRPPYSVAFRYLLYFLEIFYFMTRWSRVRTLGMACGYGIGLAAQWGVIMTFVLLIIHDPGQDFKRLEIRLIPSQKEDKVMHARTADKILNNMVDIRNRRVYGMHNTTNKPAPQSGDQAVSTPYRFVWQGQPQSFWHLMDWSIDLMTSFRGLNWNFRARVIPLPDIPLPEMNRPPIHLDSHRDEKSNPTAVPQSTIRQLRNQAFLDFVFYYIYIDFLKTCLVTEPYFLGITSLTSPTTWSWLVRLNASIPFATKFVRLCISLTSIAAALTFVFSLAPLCFAIVIPFLLGEKWTTITKNPLQEPWMYPPQWGSMFKALRTKGLAGMWGTWWHQMFRYGISEPSRFILQKFNIDGSSQLGRCIKVFVAFGLSGAIHSAASSTTFSVIPSKPLMPLFFFLCQGLGIAIQMELSKPVQRWVRPGNATRQIGNFAFVLVWLWFTGPLLADDFARCGIWLFEPVPVSLFRGMGFGPADTWFPWLMPPVGGKWVGWWKGDVWYRSGIAVF